MGRPCSPGVPMDASKAEKAIPGPLLDIRKIPRPPFLISEKSAGPAWRSDHVEQPENDQYGDDGLRTTPMEQM